MSCHGFKNLGKWGGGRSTFQQEPSGIGQVVYLHATLWDTCGGPIRQIKYIKPNCAAILNVTKDHLDWHGSMKEYINSKLKIFSNQNRNDFAFLNNQSLMKKFKKNNYESKLKYVNKKKYTNLKKKIKNNY